MSWHAVAARRFNNKITMRPLPEAPPMPQRSPVTFLDHAERLYEAQLDLSKAVVDILLLRG